MSSATPQFEDGYDSDDRPRLRLRDDAAAEDVDDAVEQAVEQCRRGEEAGRRAVFELFHGRIYRLIVRMIGRNDAADVTQDVFLRVYEKIEDFKGEARFGTWLYRIAVNECLQRLRRQSNCRMIPIANDPTDPALRHVEKTDNEELIDRAMQLLEPELRSVFLLREFEGLSYAEISLAMNLAAGTVASRLNRARLRLRDILIDLGWEP